MSQKPTNALATRAADDDRAKMTDKQLFDRLAARLTPNAEGFVQMALDWAELERRGHDLSALRNGMGEFLPLIASHRLAAEAVVAFRGQKFILKYFDGMPLELQRRLADGEPIPVYLPGQKKPASMSIAEIPKQALAWVIVNGRVLPPAEQRLARVAEKESPRLDRNHTVKVDRQTRRLKIGNTQVSTAAVVAAMSDAGGARGKIIDTPEAPARVIGGKFTDDERDRLRAAAKAHGLEEWEMVRQAVVAMWLL